MIEERTQVLEHVKRRVAEFQYEVDVRNPPDEFRRRQFAAGWGDACNRDRVYSPVTLKQLTWRNAGYRLGAQLGDIARDDIDKVFHIVAKLYHRPVSPHSGDRVEDWEPRTREDQLLERYCERVGGTVYAEVPIGGSGGTGNWPSGSSIRRIDGVRLLCAEHSEPAVVKYRPNRSLFLEELEGAEVVEIIEVKPSLNRPVIGQIIVGADMFKRQYDISPQQVIVVGASDENLEWVCRERDIAVFTV